MYGNIIIITENWKNRYGEFFERQFRSHSSAHIAILNSLDSDCGIVYFTRFVAPADASTERYKHHRRDKVSREFSHNNAPPVTDP